MSTAVECALGVPSLSRTFDNRWCCYRRAVSVEEARDWMMARDLPAHHFETSALDGPEAIREVSELRSPCAR